MLQLFPFHLAQSTERCERPPQNISLLLSPQDRILQNFRVKSDILLSQLEDMDTVERDEDISSSDEDEITEDEPERITKQKSEPAMTRGRQFHSLIPRPAKTAHNVFRVHNDLGEQGKRSQIPLLDFSDVEHNC